MEGENFMVPNPMNKWDDLGCKNPDFWFNTLDLNFTRVKLCETLPNSCLDVYDPVGPKVTDDFFVGPQDLTPLISG